MTNTNIVTKNPDHKPHTVESEDSSKEPHPMDGSGYNHIIEHASDAHKAETHIRGVLLSG